MTPPLWWLSFCDTELPKGSQFLGCTVAPGFDVSDAASAAWEAGTNPGGQVLGAMVPDHLRRYYEPCVGKLMSRSEVEAFDKAMEKELACPAN